MGVQWETNKRYQLDVKEEPNSPPARKRNDRQHSGERRSRRESSGGRRSYSRNENRRDHGESVEVKQEKDGEDHRRGRHDSSGNEKRNEMVRDDRRHASFDYESRINRN